MTRPASHLAQLAVLGRGEGADTRGVRLGGIASGVELLLEQDQGAKPARLRRRGDPDRVRQVTRPVPVRLVGMALRPR